MHKIDEIESQLPALETPIEGVDQDVQARILSDLAFWQNKTEASGGAQNRLKLYWDNVNYGSGWTPGGTPWSAAWVSYQLRDTGLEGSAAHWVYTDSVFRGNSPGWAAYSIPKNQGNIQLNIGDVLVRKRSGSNTNAHGDIVYKIEDGIAYVAGGNLSDTAKLSQKILVDENGFADQIGYQVILKKKKPPSILEPKNLLIPLLLTGLGGAFLWSRRK